MVILTNKTQIILSFSSTINFNVVMCLNLIRELNVLYQSFFTHFFYTPWNPKTPKFSITLNPKHSCFPETSHPVSLQKNISFCFQIWNQINPQLSYKSYDFSLTIYAKEFPILKPTTSSPRRITLIFPQSSFGSNKIDGINYDGFFL